MVKVFLTYCPPSHELLLAGCKRVMISYGCQTRLAKPILPPGFSDYLLDSGGFQLKTGAIKRPLYWKSYCWWIKALIEKYGDKISGYMTLDVDSPGITYENTLYMMGEGLNPMPIWKDGWSEYWLDFYAREFPYVAIGGLVGSGQKSRMYYTQLMKKLAVNYPKTKFHLLGVGISGADGFKQYPPFSVDFSTWTNPGRFGSALVHTNQGNIKQITLTDELRQKIRTNRDYKQSLVRQAIKTALSMENL